MPRAELRTFDVSETESFQALRSLILRELTGGAGETEGAVTAVLDAKGQVDIRKNTALMIEIERRLVELLERLGMGDVGALQFPANVRMMGPSAPGGPERPFDTHCLHCDLWSGAPADSLNYFLYVFVGPGCPTLEVFEPLSPADPAAAFRGPYRDSPLAPEGLLPVAFAPFAGHMLRFPTLTPHRTVRGAQAGWRISVDFRARTGHPYQFEGHRDLDTLFSADKMNSLGVYWSYTSAGSSTIGEKIARELEAASAAGEDALRARAGYISRYFPEGAGR